MRQKAQIVNDGRHRARDANVQQIRAEVEAKYADELATADFWQRMRLRRSIERELRKRLKAIAPPDGLY